MTSQLRVRVNKLLNMDDSAGRMTSALMDEMLSLLDGHQPYMLFEQLFLHQMQEPICFLLANADLINLRRVVEQGNEIWLSMDQYSSSVAHRATCSCQQAKKLQPQQKLLMLTQALNGGSTTTDLETRQGSV